MIRRTALDLGGGSVAVVIAVLALRSGSTGSDPAASAARDAEP